MKKYSKLLLPAIAVALTLAACSTDESSQQPVASAIPADGIIRVTTQVGDMRSRAGYTTDNFDNFFSLQVRNPSDANYSYYAEMDKDATTGAWGSFVPSAYANPPALTMLWKNATQPIWVSAVCIPGVSVSQADWDGIAVSVNTDQQSNNGDGMTLSDCLIMSETQIDPTKDLIDGKVVVRFKHALSKLNVTVKLGTEFNLAAAGTATNPITACAVKGTCTQATWHITDNLFPDASNVAAITPHQASYTAGIGVSAGAQVQYECILIPQDIAAGALAVSFTIGGETYTWNCPDAVTLETGKKYDLQLTIGKDVVSVGSFSATPWTDGIETTVETN